MQISQGTVVVCINLINTFLASGDLCCLLIPIYQIAVTNSLDPDQDRQNVGPDLDPKGLIL